METTNTAPVLSERWRISSTTPPWVSHRQAREDSAGIGTEAMGLRTEREPSSAANVAGSEYSTVLVWKGEILEAEECIGGLERDFKEFREEQQMHRLAKFRKHYINSSRIRSTRCSSALLSRCNSCLTKQRRGNSGSRHCRRSWARCYLDGWRVAASIGQQRRRSGPGRGRTTDSEEHRKIRDEGLPPLRLGDGEKD